MKTHAKLPARIAQVLLALALGASHGQAATLGSALDSQNFFVGDGFVWTLTVQGANKADAPVLPETPDFYNRAMVPQLLENRESKTFVYRYRMIPRRAGMIPLPDLTVQADGEELASGSRMLKVSEPQMTQRLRLEVGFDRSEVYVGQPVVLTCKLLSSLPLEGMKAMDLRLPPLYDPNFDVIVPAAERSAGGTPGTIGLPVEGQRMIGMLGKLKINGEDFDEITVRRIFVPREAGEFRFPAASLLVSSLRESTNGSNRQQRYPSYFDNDFFRDTESHESFVRYGAQSAGIAVKVRPLPQANRPPDFSGIVGHGEMLAEIAPQTLMIGDPVTLTVRLKGFALPEAVVLPPLAKLADFSGHFIVPEDQSPPRIADNEAVFVQSLRPTRTAVTQVPGLRVVVFNPDSGTYETLASKPLPLIVKPDGDITALELGPDAPSGRKPNPLGIWHNLPAGSVDPLTRVGRWAKLGTPFWLLLPPLLFIGLAQRAASHRLKKSDPNRWRKQTAFAKFRRTLRKAENAGARRVAAATYLAMRLDIEKAALTEREVLRALRRQGIDADSETRACLHALFHTADFARFGGESPANASPPDPQQLLVTIEKMERSLKS